MIEGNLQSVEVDGRWCHVCLGTDHNSGSVEKVRLVRTELGEQSNLLRFRADAVPWSEVEHDQQHSSALHVPQELMTEAFAFGCPLDETRDICDDHLEILVSSSSIRTTPRFGSNVVNG